MNIASPEGLSSANRSIGAILIDAARLTPENAERALRLSREKQIRFGDAALELGVVTADDIQFALSRQFHYAYLPSGDQSVSPELFAAFAPNSKAVEGLRALRTQLMLRWFDAEQGRKALTIVSPRHGDGRSWIAANLAVVFSQLGERTLLIDADMRRPRQHELFRLDNRSGLSSLLSGRGSDDLVQRIARFEGLSVLTAGATPPNAQELISRPAFGQLLQRFAQSHDVILIDTPPASEFADAQAVAASTAGSLMVARRHVTSSGQLREAAEFIVQAGSTIVGSVMNEI